MRDGERIAIENSPGIGDLIVLTPILRCIKRKYPHCVITVISRKKLSLFAVNRIPYIDHVHFMEGTLAGRLKTFHMLRQQDYLLLNSYQGAVARLAKLAGVRHRTGNCKDKYKNSNLFTHPLPYTNDASINQYVIDFLTSRVNLAFDDNFVVTDYQCDVSVPNEKEIGSVKTKMKANGWKGEKYILLSFQGNTATALHVNTIICTIFVLLSLEYDVVITGNRDEAITKTIDKIFPQEEHIVNLLGKTSLYEMIAAIDLSNVVVTTNSGPMHIAAALKKPTIAFFTSGNRKEWQPKKYCEAISLDLPCSKTCITDSRTCARECINFDDAFVRNRLVDLLTK